MSQDLFCGKVLLFGEYGILSGGSALASPTNLFSGRLLTDKNKIGSDSNNSLLGLANHVWENKGEFPFLNIEEILSAIKKGLYFDSTIPKGYGMGSSGAVVAAIYKHYSSSITNNNLELQNRLASIENYFHGNSSGLDPLVSFLNQTVLSSSNTLEILKDSPSNYMKDLFLLDTGIPRVTKDLVKIYKAKLLDENFQNRILAEFIPLTNNAIAHLKNGNRKDLEETVKEISLFQRKYFAEMIPEKVLPIWMNGLLSNEYTIKLCGAGGGGFLLGLCKDFSKLGKELEGFKIYKLTE